MKKSRYNIPIPIEDKVLVYNSYRDVYVLLSLVVYELLKTEAWELLESEFPKVYENLCHQGLVIDDDLDELEMLRLENKEACFSSRDYSLVVYPTLDCNLKCWYCYETHVPHSRMTPETIERILSNISLSLEENRYDSYHITFFGGEPLTDFDKIAYLLASRAKQMVEAKGKVFSCFFVTNASLIDDAIIEKFKELKPRLQITIDGSQEKHDTVRIWKEGAKPSYSSIITAVKKIVERVELEPLSITLRINYDNDTLKEAAKILEDLEGIDKSKVYFHFERVWQTMGMVDDEQRALLMETVEQFLAHGYVVHQGIFFRKCYSCPADRIDSLVVNYNGKVYKCNGRNLVKEPSCGTLTDSGKVEWDRKILSKRIGLATFENPHCLKCKMLPVCMGPCSQKLLEHGGYSEALCSLRSLEVKLNEYLLMDFEAKLLMQQYGEQQICENESR